MASAKDIGEILKNAREKKGLSIDKVYKDIRIYPGILKSLEEGNIGGALNKVYAKGFLKKYVEYLGLDKDKIFKDYDKIFPKEPEKKIFIGDKEPAKNSEFVGIIFGIIAAILIVIFASVSVSKGVSKMKAFFSARIVSKVKEVATPLPAKEGKKDIKIEKTSQAVPAAQKIMLSVKTTTHDVWMRVKKDGNTVFNGILAKDSREAWVAEKDFELKVGKLEYLEFRINEKDMGIIGSGVQDISINKEGIRIGKTARKKI